MYPSPPTENVACIRYDSGRSLDSLYVCLGLRMQSSASTRRYEAYYTRGGSVGLSAQNFELSSISTRPIVCRPGALVRGTKDLGIKPLGILGVLVLPITAAKPGAFDQ